MFELAFDDTLFGYRSFNFSPPWAFQRPHITCFESAGTMYLDAGPGYSSYRWNNAATTQVIPVTIADTFFVFVPYGQGGFISSEKLIVTNINDPCSTGLDNISNNDQVNIYPNPVHDILSVMVNDQHSSNMVLTGSVEICDASGRAMTKNICKILSQKDVINFDLADLKPGVYFIRINEKTFKFIKL